MKSANVNLVRFLLVSSLSSLLLLPISAQTEETNSTVTGKTNSTDVLAIQMLVDTFSIYDATEDPCLPEPYSWVKCSSDDTPRITEINLHGSSTLSLWGSSLPDFSAMDALEKIDLGANILLDGDFPDFLASFPKLKVLYLVGTTFTGTVPTSLKKRSDKKTLTLMLSGIGTDLCYSDDDVCPVESPDTGTGTSPDTGTGTSPGATTTQAKAPKKNTAPIVAGTLVPIFVIFSAIIGFLTVRHQKRKAAAVAAGKLNGNSGSAMPTFGNNMSPSPLLPADANFQDLEGAAQNILHDDEGANVDQHTHPTTS